MPLLVITRYITDRSVVVEVELVRREPSGDGVGGGWPEQKVFCETGVLTIRGACYYWRP